MNRVADCVKPSGAAVDVIVAVWRRGVPRRTVRPAHTPTPLTTSAGATVLLMTMLMVKSASPTGHSGPG